MKNIKFMALLFVATLFCSLGVFAKEESFRDSVEKLLLLTQQDKIANQVFEQVKPMVLQQLSLTNISKEQSVIIDKFMNKIFDALKDEMSWDKMKVDYIQIYMSVYTKEEIQQLIAFYQSPIGQKMIEKTPLLIQQSMIVNQKNMKRILPKIQEISQEMITEMMQASKEGNP